MKRILRPKRIVVLIETMGSLRTWSEVPERHVELYTYSIYRGQDTWRLARGAF
jgi:hypothetical protein